MTLEGKVALVTGSTSGIGLGIARSLAGAGASIMMNGFGDADEIETLRAQLCEEFGVSVAFDGADLSRRDEVSRLVGETIDVLGGIDVLVNNAGIQFVAPIEEFPEERLGGDHRAQSLGRLLFDEIRYSRNEGQGLGRVINVASAHGLVASPYKVAYVAAKHGLVGATKVAALELANQGVTVNAICPGWVLTPLVERQLLDRAEQAGTVVEVEMERLLAEKQPMSKFTTPESIGAMAVFLCSDEAETITGAALFH